MRQKRQQRITDTNRILQFLYSEGWSDSEIAVSADCSIRSIQRWWDDVCPSPKKFHRLWMLEEKVKARIIDHEKRLRLIEEHGKREDTKRRWQEVLQHHEDIPHPNGECPECLRIMGIKTE